MDDLPNVKLMIFHRLHEAVHDKRHADTEFYADLATWVERIETELNAAHLREEQLHDKLCQARHDEQND